MDSDEEEIINNSIDLMSNFIFTIPESINIYKESYHNSMLSGQRYYLELIESSNEQRFIDVARMRKSTFITLINVLENHYNLKSTSLISVGEKVMITIYILQGLTIRNTAERFQHSLSTISTIFKDLIQKLSTMFNDLASNFKESGDCPEYIRSNYRFWPYFKNCLGALDGTHVSASIAENNSAPFRNRKGYISQNVLGIVDFRMVFTYVLAGWEGSAHDGKVLQDALTKGLVIPPGKYYLGDAGYGLSGYCLTPYRGIRYHLKEFRRGNRKPQNKEELFNLRHASLRNVIERSFGVLKKRFNILNCMRNFTFDSQINIVYSTMALHNFIRIYQSIPDKYDDEDNNGNDDASDDDDDDIVDNSDRINNLKNWRNQIAEDMWNDYNNYQLNRNN
mmetsp:Transcript_24507/g.22267  ORF Transcript_24507/g.22267 Transcript_24507/m.22267 type:complete len:393 (+) Transcript_24507:74-1252(+)